MPKIRKILQILQFHNELLTVSDWLLVLLTTFYGGSGSGGIEMMLLLLLMLLRQGDLQHMRFVKCTAGGMNPAPTSQCN